ncbi:transposable element Tcb1 transposase [Trichonephila clavipes]|nr:transposable element Tcb1 transposase [Trichonephila clavipes]
MTGHIYRDVILEKHERLFRGAMGAEFLFMDDNARPHRANIVDECLQSEDITTTRGLWRRTPTPDENLRTTPKLGPPLLTTAPPHGRKFKVSTDLTCIAALHGSSSMTDHLIGTSAHAPQHPMVTYTGLVPSENINIALFSSTRAFDDGPRYFEQWSSDRQGYGGPVVKMISPFGGNRNVPMEGKRVKDGKEKWGWTDHLIGTSARASQRPMVTYTGMGIVGPGSHGLLRH